MRAVVTGARGFVGPHLIAHLEAHGDEVTGLDFAGPERFDVTDADAVREHLGAAAPEVVYHLAALSHVGESWANPSVQFRVNAEGTLNVVAAAAALGIRRVVVIGSSEEYGEVDPGANPVDETTPLRPVTPYGAAKAAAETVALQMGRATDLEVVCVRPFPHTGPGQTDRFLVPALAARIAAAERDGTDTVVMGSRTPMRDLSDVRDVVRGIEQLLEVDAALGGVFNIGSDRKIGIRALAELVIRRTASRSVIASQTYEAAFGEGFEDLRAREPDLARVRGLIGFDATIPLEQTIDDIVAWLDAASHREHAA